MVALQDVVSSNERIRSALPKGMVAVFVGGTSGVGEYTVKAFAKYAAAPRVYIVGRSQDAADRIMSECEEINADGEYQFIKADISLLKTVDDVCREICSKEMAIHLLFQSQGSMAYNTSTLQK
jgi:NAD(P)-dependent dehydrogenase (short-subunit alcohol dehydrogenase family)